MDRKYIFFVCYIAPSRHSSKERVVSTTVRIPLVHPTDAYSNLLHALLQQLEVDEIVILNFINMGLEP